MFVKLLYVVTQLFVDIETLWFVDVETCLLE